MVQEFRSPLTRGRELKFPAGVTISESSVKSPLTRGRELKLATGAAMCSAM